MKNNELTFTEEAKIDSEIAKMEIYLYEALVNGKFAVNMVDANLKELH